MGCGVYLEIKEVLERLVFVSFPSAILTVIVQGELVEHPAAGLLPDILVNGVSPQLVQAHRVRERFGRRLQLRNNFISIMT